MVQNLPGKPRKQTKKYSRSLDWGVISSHRSQCLRRVTLLSFCMRHRKSAKKFLRGFLIHRSMNRFSGNWRWRQKAFMESWSEIEKISSKNLGAYRRLMRYLTSSGMIWKCYLVRHIAMNCLLWQSVYVKTATSSLDKWKMTRKM